MPATPFAIRFERSLKIMQCPGCGAAMQRLTVEAVLGATMQIDVCSRCRAFWFDPFESIQLTPASTLRLFQLIAEQASAGGSAPWPLACNCPKCGARLLPTHDRQRNTPFEYLRCEVGHGRFTRFTDFLKEKDFIRPLSSQQIHELSQSIRMIHCSNCGASIDLAKSSACGHCGSPLSILDIRKMAEMASQVHTVLQPPPALTQPHREISALITGRAKDDRSSFNLVDAGLRAVAEWLRHLVH